MARLLANGTLMRTPLNKKVLVYPRAHDTSAVTLTNDELNRLDDDGWANDTIVDFYLKYIQAPLALAYSTLTRA